MLTRIALVTSYILYCIRFAVGPWKYFQLNADYFNEQRNLFSKLDIDARIPKQWRLVQFMDIGNNNPSVYPVFMKPEWGQNSQGIVRIDNLDVLQKIRRKRSASPPFYLLQQAAPGKREFEIFVIPEKDNLQQFAVLSITETCNRGDDPLPINGIYNANTYYRDCLAQLSFKQQNKIWSHLKQIGEFRIARYGVRADSLESLIAGQFHIIEINLYVPMPLILLVQDVSLWQKMKFIRRSMKQLAKVTTMIPRTQAVKSVFFNKLKSAQRLKRAAKNETSL
ncbi:MAG: hypothetical protein ACJAU1_000713 [Psychromonas sp.]